jgi:hypothetical protein
MEGGGERVGVEYNDAKCAGMREAAARAAHRTAELEAVVRTQ